MGPRTSTTGDRTSRLIGIDGKAGDFDEGHWVRLERDLLADARAAWGTGLTINRITGIHLWSSSGGTIKMDGLSFSNSLTVEHNVLGPGVIAHILLNRNINTSTYAMTDSWFHYDQVGSVMLVSNGDGALQATHHQDAWGNVLSAWDTGYWAPNQNGWHHNTKATDGDLGLVYMYQRWYHPELLRFSSVSPMPDHVEQPFTFADGRPSAIVDPTGMLFWSPCLSTRRFSGSAWYNWALAEAAKRGKGDKFAHCFLACGLRNCFGPGAALVAQLAHETSGGWNLDGVLDTLAAMGGIACPLAVPCGTYCGALP